MNLVAIRQEKSGKNIFFVTDDFKKYSLSQLLNKTERIPLSNIQIIAPQLGSPYLRSTPNNDASDNLDEIAITCNEGDYLLFDREYLYLKALNGRLKRKWKSFSGDVKAVLKDQDKTDFGPLPEGAYVVHFEKTVDYENNEGIWDAIKWKIKSSRWGYIATPLEQIKGASFGRGDFYIHSGKVLGTGGCIELNGELNEIFSKKSC